ncbi:AMP-binding protein [Catenulispora subtropica]|uniref:AMP-binding protein n=1 Tax=Catenulispora subtropica TaxID=450798 RepID=UPI0031DBF59E
MDGNDAKGQAMARGDRQPRGLREPSSCTATGSTGSEDESDQHIVLRFAEENFPDCFALYGNLLSWDTAWKTVLEPGSEYWTWFAGGQLNVSFNCVDRHLAHDRNKAAFIWVPEPESDGPRAMTYQVLFRKVNEFAALLRDTFGVTAGDRVAIHLPTVPELPVSMLACARLGAIHCVIDPETDPEGCATQITDSGSRVVVTMDGKYRAGELCDHKAVTDDALRIARTRGHAVESVLVWRRWPREYSSRADMVEGRDFFCNDAVTDHRGKTVEPVPMPAEAPLFLLYADTVAGPSGYQYSTAGYLAYAAGICKYYYDIHIPDTHWCAADPGGLTGHTALIYGPLALGATSVLYEGSLTYPDAGRPWRIAERHGITAFHADADAVELLRRLGPAEPARYRHDFKHIGVFGTQLAPDTRRWFDETVGRRRAALTETWWEHEAGGLLGGVAPALHPVSPEDHWPLALGLYGAVYDDQGRMMEPGSGLVGDIYIRRPWPGMPQTIWGRPERFRQMHLGGERHERFFTGRRGTQDSGGCYRIVPE